MPTDHSGGRRWVRIAILVAVLYLTVAIVTGTLAARAASSELRFFWRLSAFIISGAALLAHIAYEHFRRRSPARSAAWHTSAAVSLGALLLALTANIHDLTSPAGYRPQMLLALVIWPLGLLVPAFVAALAIAFGLGVIRRRA